MSLLTLEALSVRLGGRAVVENVTLSVASGECVGLIGPNGAGKSTLMRAALGMISFTGTSNLAKLSPHDRALAAAWLPQHREIAWNIVVEELVALGRLPHRRPGAPLSKIDVQKISDAMRSADLTTVTGRSATSLSGGEQARVLLARALAQDAPLTLADEPIASLDPAHQIATMEVFLKRAGKGCAVVTALHDLSLAARWCTRLILMHRGHFVADGTPAEVLTPDTLRAVYGVKAHIMDTPDGLIIVPLSRCSQ